MPLIKRLVKGSALTYAEMDGNLTYLDNKVSGSDGYITLISGSNAVTSSILYQSGSIVKATGSLDINGAVSASTFIGDGSQLTGIEAGASDKIYVGEISASVSTGNKLFSLTSASVNFGEINLITNNTSFGQETLWSGSNGNFNTAYGYRTLKSNTGGFSNTAIGSLTLNSNTIGFGNTGIGASALSSITTGDENVAIGALALEFNTTGSNNTAVGTAALNFNIKDNNVAIGNSSGINNITGSGNVFLGYQAGYQETGSNKLYIANSDTNAPLIKGDFSTGLLQFNTTLGTQISGSLRVSQGINAGAIVGTSLSATTGSLSVNYNNRSNLFVDPFYKYLAYTDATDPFNQFAIWLSGSNSNSEILLQSGLQGLSIDNRLKVLQSGVQVTGSLTVSGSNTFTNIGPAIFSGSVNITGSLLVNGSPIASSVFTGSYATTGSNTFVGNQIISGNLVISGSSVIANQSTFNAGVTINGTNSQLYNGVGFLDLAGASGSRIDFHGRDGIATLQMNVNDFELFTQTGSVNYQIIDGDFSVYTSGSILFTSNVTASEDLKVEGNVLIGTSSFTPTANEKLIIDAGDSTSYNLITGRSNTDNYNQLNLQNINSGSSASTDFVATNNLGDENTYYVNLGINSSTFTGSIGGPNDAYLYTTGSDLHILNITPGKNIILGTAGSGIIEITGSTDQTGTSSVNGQLLVNGSSTLSGNNLISGSLTVSASHDINDPNNKIYGDVEINGGIKFSPVIDSINTTLSGSYIFSSGSTNDLYFVQNASGYANTTRLRWLEGNLYTGLLNGGLITTQSSTVYQVSSGSGVIVSLNASYNDNPYPTIQYVSWNNLSASIAPLSASYDQSFVAIQASGSTGQIYVQGTPYSDGQFNTLIPIGNVIHQNRSTINAWTTYPSVAYGWKQRSSDFIRAFGPLKISGLNAAVSGSSTGSLIITPGTAYSEGRNYLTDPSNPSYVQDAGTNTSKIFRYYQSGSGFVYLTNGGAGYETIDPTQYSLNGTLTPVPSNNFSIQRVFYFPAGATKGIYVYYGNATYATLADAVANLQYEPFTEAPNTAAGAVFSAYLILRNNASFQTSGSYRIEQAGLFRNVAGSAGGGTVTATRLLDLTDVDLVTSAPTNGQPLVYNNSISKWQNASAISASLFGNASTATTAATASSVGSLNQNVYITGSVNVSGSVVQLNKFNYQTGSYTILPSDSSKIIEMDSGSLNYLIIPDNSVTPLPIGFEALVVQYGVGQTQITSGSINVTIRSANNYTKIGSQNAPVTITKRAENEWYIFGSLTA